MIIICRKSIILLHQRRKSHATPCVLSFILSMCLTSPLQTDDFFFIKLVCVVISQPFGVISGTYNIEPVLVEVVEGIGPRNEMVL